MPTPISYLFVPGNRPERYDKAMQAGAGAVIVDLEDAVPVEAKTAAREALQAWLPQAAAPVVVRVNAADTPWFGEDLAACAVARGLPVGIDAERPDRRLDLDGMARVAFAGPERAQLAAAAPEERNTVFFGIWTLKEAYIKARGMGLALPLKSFSVTVAPPAITPAPDDPQAWHAELTRPTADHVMALAVPRGTVVVYRPCPEPPAAGQPPSPPDVARGHR